VSRVISRAGQPGKTGQFALKTRVPSSAALLFLQSTDIQQAAEYPANTPSMVHSIRLTEGPIELQVRSLTGF